MIKLHHPKNRYERRKLAAKKSLKRLGATDARRQIPAEEVSAEESEAIDSLPPLVARELREHVKDIESS